MKNEKLVTFACFVENHLIEKVWFVRHVTANVQHMVESFTKNYRQLVFALDVVKTSYMVMKKVVLSVGQNQPKPCQRYVLLMSKNTMRQKAWRKARYEKDKENGIFSLQWSVKIVKIFQGIHCGFLSRVLFRSVCDR